MIDILNLTGKTALVTGASSGLGWRFSQTLAEAGAKVIVVARRKDKLQQLVCEIEGKGGRASYLIADIANLDSVYKAFTFFKEQKIVIDILVNNAGISKMTPIFTEQEPNLFEDIIQTNTIGLWHITKQTAVHMKEHEVEGSIINIGSVYGANKFQEGISAYCASKAAVIQLTKCLAGELAKNKIRINCILPGLFHTPLTDYKINTEKSRKTIEESIPLGFIANPKDLDGTILLLSSNKASRYMTGSCITIDGGSSCTY